MSDYKKRGARAMLLGDDEPKWFVNTGMIASPIFVFDVDADESADVLCRNDCITIRRRW